MNLPRRTPTSIQGVKDAVEPAVELLPLPPSPADETVVGVEPTKHSTRTDDDVGERPVAEVIQL